MEFIRQTLATLETGEWSIFQTYVVFVWCAMLPRMLGAGVFYCFRPPKPSQLTIRYMLGYILALASLWTAAMLYAAHLIAWWAILIVVFLVFFSTASSFRRWLVQLTFATTFYGRHVAQVKQVGPHKPRTSIALMTVFDEDEVFLDECLRKIRASFEKADGKFVLVAIIDGYGRFPHAEVELEVAKRYCDLVMTSNAQNKRENLRAMFKEIDENRGWVPTGEEIIHFIDSDTLPASDNVATELIRPFADPAVGGVTSAQLVYNPQSFWQHMSYLFEAARLNSSMAFMALFGSVGCLPGRWYAVRAKYLKEGQMDALATDSFSYFGFMRRPCVAGDDRFITNCILKAGGKTILAPTALVYTLAPARFSVLRKMWVRWGRSSQGYTLRSPWLFRRGCWSVAFTYWTDIVLSFFTVFIVFVYWPWTIFFGDREMVFWIALLYSLFSMTLVMCIRQSPTLVKDPKYLWAMPVFGFVGAFGHLCRVEAFLTQHLIGKWGTRKGADDNKAKHLLFEVKYDKCCKT